MKTFVSMLRGINVSGQKKIQMADLKNLYETVGLVKVRTYLQSGNVVFETTEQDIAKLTAVIEGQIEETFGYAAPVFILGKTDLAQIIVSNPFLTERAEDPAKLHVTFLYNPLADKSKLDNLSITPAGADELFVGGQEIFLYCPNGYGRTRLSNNFFERKLQVFATTRNWKTVMALHQMANL